uniref:Kinesin-like protein n=1 Tax=Phascolosoma esculenta TaxID=419950 RepID=A0A7R6KIZ0_9ANNE|nr:KIFC1 [Phascolosoma esculenta]
MEQKENSPPAKEMAKSQIARVKPLSKLPTPRSKMPVAAPREVPQAAPSAGPAKRKPNTLVQPAAKRPRTEPPLPQPGLRRATSTSSLTSRKPGARQGGDARQPAGRGTGSSAPTRRPGAPPPAPTVSKKRPAWDVKGRLADIEKELKNQRSINEGLAQQRNAFREQVNNISSTAAQMEKETSQKQELVQSLQAKLREREQDLEETSGQAHRLETKVSRLQQELAASQQTVEALQSQITGLKSSIASLTAQQASATAERDAYKLECDSLKQTCKENTATIKEQKETIEAMKEKERAWETERRWLHNTVQELKGNIRVFCRIRPLLEEEKREQEAISHLSVDTETCLLVDKLNSHALDETSSIRKADGDNKYEFNFDKIYGPWSTQESVFNELSQLVQSALDGYNVCIFAYGQTGSGKTYTMEGPEQPDETTQGVIPRAVLQIFKTTETLRSKGWQYGLEASFLEIYNEMIQDLLGDVKDNIKHEIRMVNKGSHDVMVTNLTVKAVTSPKQVHDLLRKASANRAVASTNCNERSSRSHSVFMLKIRGENPITGETSHGVLNLVDLAGSERLKESGSTGARLKETQAINKSLSSLGNVIMALANKEKHEPYRTSKLTHLLQNSLGGNSKTLMFVNISPREEHFGETLCSLRFATKVNNCNMGTAQKRMK